MSNTHQREMLLSIGNSAYRISELLDILSKHFPANHDLNLVIFDAYGEAMKILGAAHGLANPKEAQDHE